MNTTDRTPTARRSFLRGVIQTAAAAAGALFLQPASASAVVAPVPAGQLEPTPIRPEPAHIHLPGGMHEKFRGDDDLFEEGGLEDRIEAMLPPEGRGLVIEYSDRRTTSLVNEQDRFVEELARHFPQLAPAIGCVAYHVNEGRLDDDGVCCAHPWEDVLA